MKYLLIITTMFFFTFSLNSQDMRRDKRIKKIEAHRIAFITKVLDLTPEESEKFWPLYNEYTEKSRKLRQKFEKNKPKKGMTEAEANKVIDSYFDNEQKKLTLKRNYYDKFKMILPAQKVVKLHIAENRFKKKLLKKLKRNKRQKEGRRRR